MFGSSRWHPSRLVRALIAVGLGIVGAILVWTAMARPSTSDPALTDGPRGHSLPSTSPEAPQPSPEESTPQGEQTYRDKVSGLVLPESDPVAVAIPSLGVRSRLVELGVDDAGAMEVPQDPAEAGWFTGGAARVRWGRR
jgi:hypothetical protein